MKRWFLCVYDQAGLSRCVNPTDSAVCKLYILGTKDINGMIRDECLKTGAYDMHGMQWE